MLGLLSEVILQRSWVGEVWADPAFQGVSGFYTNLRKNWVGRRAVRGGGFRKGKIPHMG